MKIKIGHLYGDIANLYGENANVRMMERAITKQGITVETKILSLEDTWNLNGFDILYVGTYLEENTTLLKEHFAKHKKKIKNFINRGGFVLATGNGLDLFSEILSFAVKEIDFRIMGDQVYETNLISSKIIGFENRNTILTHVQETPLFRVLKGTGFGPNDTTEGLMHKHFYGTYLLGPLLVRNPYFLEYFIQEVVNSKGSTIKEVQDEIFYQAYEQYFKNFPLENESK